MSEAPSQIQNAMGHTAPDRMTLTWTTNCLIHSGLDYYIPNKVSYSEHYNIIGLKDSG